MKRRAPNSIARIRAKGFSLVELLVVLVIVILISYLASEQLTVVHRNRALFNCQNNLQKIYLALSIYENDHDGAMPAVKGARVSAEPLSLLVPKSTTTTEIFICPGSTDAPLPEAEPFATRKISYAYYMGCSTNTPAGQVVASDAQMDVAPKKKGEGLFSADGGPGHNHGKAGGNLLFCNGEVHQSGTNASVDLPIPPGVQLLNPQ